MRDEVSLVDSALAPPGREEKIQINGTHAVLNTSMLGPYDPALEQVIFGLGCFWGAERKFWALPGVHTTAVGYSAGFTPNPSYQEVCSGLTGHNEVVLVVFDPVVIDFYQLLAVFWQSHNPTQGLRQGNDYGSQYRSGIYTFNDVQARQAQASKDSYEQDLQEAGFGAVTTEIKAVDNFNYAEEYHQQYLHKNPKGYCGLGGTGVSCGSASL